MAKDSLGSVDLSEGAMGQGRAGLTWRRGFIFGEDDSVSKAQESPTSM